MSRIFLTLLIIQSWGAYASPEKLHGKWTCTQSYEVEGGLFFESKYSVTHKFDDPLIYQVGVIKLTDNSTPPKVSSIQYSVQGSFAIVGDKATAQPLNIKAQTKENTLGVITPEFLEDFLSNRKEYNYTVEFISDNELKSVFDTGDVINCERVEL